jgi:hypothetical protein
VTAWCCSRVPWSPRARRRSRTSPSWPRPGRLLERRWTMPGRLRPRSIPKVARLVRQRRLAAGRPPRRPGLVARPVPRVRQLGRRLAPARWWGPTRWLGPGPRTAGPRGCLRRGRESRQCPRRCRPDRKSGSGRPAPPWQLPVPAGRPGQVRESGQDRGVGLDAGLGELRVSGGGPDGQRVRNWWVRCRWSRSRWARKRRTRIQWIPNRWMRSAQGRSTPTPPKPRLPTLTRRNPRSPRSWRCRWWCEG